MNIQKIKDIRNFSFHKKIEFDLDLYEICKNNSEHSFLRNPTAQYTYQYLIDFVKSYSELYFNRKINSIKVLDWGTGKGHISYFLKNMNADFKSCDIDDNSDDSTFGQTTPIIKASNLEVIPLKHEYILPFEDASFDVVLSFGVLEHVPNEKESLKEINRILKKEGLFFCFFLPQKLSWTQKISHLRGNYYHDRLYNKKIIHNLCQSKFEILDSWSRALFPKNNFKYPAYRMFEKADQWLCKYTFFKNLATNIEFVSKKI